MAADAREHVCCLGRCYRSDNTCPAYMLFLNSKICGVSAAIGILLVQSDGIRLAERCVERLLVLGWRHLRLVFSHGCIRLAPQILGR